MSHCADALPEATYRYLWGFLTVGMRPGCEAWEVVSMARKGLAGCAVVFLASRGAGVQVTALLGICITSLLLQVVVVPYDRPVLNGLQVAF